MPCECEIGKRNYYQYYDTPDGCDVDKKVMVATRYGVITGLIAGTYDVMMYSHAIGLGPIMKRYALHTIPLGLMGATFALVSNGLQRMRDRDDGLNYFLGGFACGPILASYLGSKHAVLLGGLALGTAAYIKKTAVEQCVTIFPHIPHNMGSITKWRHDYSLSKDPRDSWQHTCGAD